MKKILKITLLLAVFAVLGACKKEEKLNVDFSQYNVDDPVANIALDQWLTTNFLNPYNVEVIYRYNRYLHETSKNVAAVQADKVQPQMQLVLGGLIAPYQKIAGTVFMKNVMPKQVVLYGSGVVNADGSVNLGTMEGGTKLNIYLVNTVNLNSIDTTARRIRTLYHEFTHAINNRIPIPTDFQQISKGNYTAAWTATTDAQAKSLGFVSRYATSSPEEDFAEVVAKLLGEGQLWYDTWPTTDAAKTVLKAKKASVVKYYADNFGINFNTLQEETQNTLENKYNYNWLKRDLYKTITIDLDNTIYTNYPMPNGFATVYKDFKSYALNTGSIVNGSTTKSLVTNLQFIFSPSTSELTVRVPFRIPATTSGTLYNADFRFTYSILPTGGIVFTKAAQGTSGNARNVQYLTGFEQTVQAYLTQNTFVASWLASNINAANTTTNLYGGLYVLGQRDNYFYGLLGN